MTDDERDDEDYFVHSTPTLSFKKETTNSKNLLLLFLNECAPQRKFIRLLQMSIQKDKTAKEGTTCTYITESLLCVTLMYSLPADIYEKRASVCNRDTREQQSIAN